MSKQLDFLSDDGAELFDKRPPAVNVDTSRAAAASIAPSVGRLRELVADCVREGGARGRTCDEVEKLADLSHQTASARLRELTVARSIVRTDRTRQTRSGRAARVYVTPENNHPF